MHTRWLQVVIAGAMLAVGLVWLASWRWSFGFQHSGKRYEWFVVQGDLWINTLAPGYVARHPGYTWPGGFQVNPAHLFRPWVSLPRVAHVDTGFWCVTLPLYVPFVALGVVFAYPRLPFVQRQWRRRRGLCVRCGYDLTGNVSGVCPECGTALVQAKQEQP